MQHDSFHVVQPNRSSDTQEEMGSRAVTRQDEVGSIDEYLQRLQDSIGEELFPEFVDLYQKFLDDGINSDEFEAQTKELAQGLDVSISIQQLIDWKQKMHSVEHVPPTNPKPTGRQQPRKAAKQQKDSAVGHERLGIVWHKWSDLRLHDHEPAVRAHREADIVIHVHVVEEMLLVGNARGSGLPRCGPQRRIFWKECVSDLAQQLMNINRQELVVANARSPAHFFEALLPEVMASGDIPKFSSVTLYTHAEFCSEELETEGSVRETLARVSDQIGVPCEIRTFWGGLTVHHKEDLEKRNMSHENFPLFKVGTQS